jgi:hypothetical protein
LSCLQQGGLGNTGISYYNGDIAGLGAALTGFTTAIVSGTIFLLPEIR